MPVPDDDGLSALIRREATRHAAPVGLAERIAADLRGTAPAAAPPTPARPWRRWFDAALVFGAGAATAWLVLASVVLPGSADGIGDEIAASHVRSLMAAHLTDVTSTDRHTVKPWFAGKLDFSPPVTDLAAQGYALAGGRLDVIGGRPVAALVYQERQHVINLFVWPAPAGRTSAQTRQGYSLVGWTQGGMQFWAVSDASLPDLQAFAQTLRERIAAPPASTPAGKP
jgi:anti-sigma factor RsiW